MQQFKQDKEADLSCLEHYSSEELSLLNSRRRHHGAASERQSQIQRQNEQQMKEFKRQIQERYKLSICNKIYTFPRIIKSFADILSSEEEEDIFTNEEMKFNDRRKVFEFKKKDKNVFQHSKQKINENQSNEPSKIIDSVKVGKDKLKTNESTGKRKEEDLKEKIKIVKIEKASNTKKDKKLEGLKTQQQSSANLLQTLRSKATKKN